MKLLTVFLLVFSINSNAEIYKCGNVYTQDPCSADAVVLTFESTLKTKEHHTSHSASSGKRIKVMTGKVIRVADGDTITIKTYNGKEKIRFAQIDAPETSHFGKKSQPYGKEAGLYLRQRVMNKNVRVDVEAVDQYGRNVGTVYLEGNNINRELVENGFAWIYRQYAHDTELLNLEKVARARKIGLWGLDNPIYPPDFRKANK